MATEQKTGTHHPDVARDFETGTVNPGPGMAGPLDGKTHPSGDQAEAGGQGQTKKGQQGSTGTQSGKDGCGCG